MGGPLASLEVEAAHVMLRDRGPSVCENGRDHHYVDDHCIPKERICRLHSAFVMLGRSEFRRSVKLKQF
jgi:hypothetical protein